MATIAKAAADNGVDDDENVKYTTSVPFSGDPVSAPTPGIGGSLTFPKPDTGTSSQPPAATPTGPANPGSGFSPNAGTGPSTAAPAPTTTITGSSAAPPISGAAPVAPLNNPTLTPTPGNTIIPLNQPVLRADPSTPPNPGSGFSPNQGSGPNVSAPPLQATPPAQSYSYNDPTTGKPVTSTTLPPPGVPYQLSAGLNADGTATTAATPTNALAGYVSPEGGTFGADNSSLSNALRSLESSSGVDSGTTWNAATNSASGGDPTKFGLPANATVQDVAALGQQLNLIAQGNPAAIQAGLASANPFLKQIASNYASGQGSAGPAYVPPTTGTPPVVVTPPGGGALPVPGGTTTSDGGNNPTGTPGTTTAPAGTGTAAAAPGTPAAGANVNDVSGLWNSILAQAQAGIANPSPYDSNLFAQQEALAKQSYDKNTNALLNSTKADLLRRGVNFGQLGGGELSDASTTAQQGWQNILTQMLTQRAQGIGADTTAASNNALNALGFTTGQSQQAFTNNVTLQQLQEMLREGQEGTNLNWAQLANSYGSNPTAANTINTVGNEANTAAGAAGTAASANQTALMQAIQQLIAQYGGAH